MKPADFGPFVSAILAAIIPAGLMIAIVKGLAIEMMSVLTVIVPGIALAVLMVAVSMAWIFILIGRLQRQPKWMPATICIMGFAMLELLTIVIALGRPTS